jgi:hypothetical protein
MTRKRRDFLKQSALLGFSLESLPSRLSGDLSKEMGESKLPFSTVWNKQIEDARNLALSLLKPTPKQIEHGLDLRKNSIVIAL